MLFLIRFCHGSTRLPTLTAMFHYHTPFSLSVSSLITAARSSSSYPILQMPPPTNTTLKIHYKSPSQSSSYTSQQASGIHPSTRTIFHRHPATHPKTTPEPKPPDPAETSSHPLPDPLDEEIPSPETLPSVVGDAEIVTRNGALLWSGLER